MDKKEGLLCSKLMNGAKVVAKVGLEAVAGGVLCAVVLTSPISIPLVLDAIHGVPSQTSGTPLEKPYQYENKGYHSVADFPPTGPIKDFGSFDYYPPNYWSGNEGR